MNTFNETIENMNALGAKNYENMLKLSEMQASNMNALFEKQVEVFNLFMNTATSQIELASEAKDVQETLRGQVALGQKLAEELIEKTRETAGFVQKAGEELRTWGEEIVKETADKVGEAAKQAA